MVNNVTSQVYTSNIPLSSNISNEKVCDDSSHNHIASDVNNTSYEEKVKDTVMFYSLYNEENDDSILANYKEDTFSEVISDIRKEYIEKNRYIDENTQISVLELFNKKTDNMIAQYPTDNYLDLIYNVRQINNYLNTRSSYLKNQDSYLINQIA